MDEVQTELAALRQRISDLENRLAAKPEVETGGSHTRRNILMGAAAVVAGGAAAVAGSPARAADTDPLTLGQNNTAEHPTSLTFDGSSIGDDDQAFSAGDGARTLVSGKAAVLGYANGGYRVGVMGDDQTTELDTIGVLGLTSKGIGVTGAGLSAEGWGVLGQSRGLGVIGQSTLNTPKSIGVVAAAGAPKGTALAIAGIVRASRAGVATVPAGKRFITVNLAPVNSFSALVFANLQPYTGTLAVAGVAIGTDKFNIYLTAVAPAGGVKVGWVVIDRLGTVLNTSEPAAFAEEVEPRTTAPKLVKPKLGK